MIQNVSVSFQNECAIKNIYKNEGERISIYTGNGLLSIFSYFFSYFGGYRISKSNSSLLLRLNLKQSQKKFKKKSFIKTSRVNMGVLKIVIFKVTLTTDFDLHKSTPSPPNQNLQIPKFLKLSQKKLPFCSQQQFPIHSIHQKNRNCLKKKTSHLLSLGY